MSGYVSSRYPLSKSGKRDLIRKLEKTLPQAVELIHRSKRVEIARLRFRDLNLIIIDGIPALVLEKELVYPTVLAPHKLSLRLPHVVVDMGAVPHILNGADVMAPGIVDFDEFEKDAIVYVSDEEKRREFAIGQALVDSKRLKNMKRGKVIRNLHYAGDKLWQVIITI